MRTSRLLGHSIKPTDASFTNIEDFPWSTIPTSLSVKYYTSPAHQRNFRSEEGVWAPSDFCWLTSAITTTLKETYLSLRMDT